MDPLRNLVPWRDDQWGDLQTNVVGHEVEVARESTKFLPPYPAPLSEATRTIPFERLDPATGTVDDVTTLAIVEGSVRFDLNKQQVLEDNLSSAKTLTRRAANTLTRLREAIIFNGQPGAGMAPVIAANLPLTAVQFGGANGGLLGIAPNVVRIQRNARNPYGDRIVTGVVDAITQLENNGYLGPFVAILSTREFVEANRPNQNSLVLPKDRIDPLLERDLLRSSVIPPDRGMVISLGGSPLDLAVAVAPKLRVVTVDEATDLYRFRVYERFVLRVKEPQALVRMEFA